ncbi:hypothetical protein ACIA5D_03645 [Actinoplanes sp. NPDC051513]|uniref:5'-methylthioadenosine/S-adenosylhomocysteine nucleosidase family protein n=1 Tax=Actinoplanes sp. NPDC051513 TaxID=3363908 RepID=UPI0037BCB1EC
MTSLGGVRRPAMRDCRAAARSVRAAEVGAETIRFLRPRTLGLFRTRAPVSLQLYRAAGEGRLIWQGPRSFAMLSRPADRAPSDRGRALRWIDQQWSLVMLAFVFVLFVVLAFAIAALHGLIGPVATWFALTILEALLFLVVLADQVVSLLATAWRGLRALVRGRPRAGQVAAERLPYEEWTMRLCHHDDERGAADLLAAVAGRLVALAGPDVALACPRGGITTSTMRARVAGWAEGLDDSDDREISVRIPRQLPARRHRFVDTGSFVFLWLAVITVLLLVLASLVAQAERNACAGTCTGRPATYTTALEWFGYRLMWQEPPGLTAATPLARGAGLMAEFMLLFTVVVAVAGGVRYAGYRKLLGAEHEQRMSEMYGRERVLLVVATPVEQEAVLRQARTYRGADPVREFGDGHPVHRLGVIGGTDVVLAHVGQGMTSLVSAPYSLPLLLDEWQPGYVIMLGICFGLREERQRLGDVIVTEQLQVISVRAGETEIRDRGDKVTAGHRLVERFRVAAPPPGVRMWLGLLLSWDVLVDSGPLREALKARYPDAEGGEMEGAGVYASSVRAGTEWIVVKGICDWGRDKNSDAQELAAANAATLVLDLIAARAFAPRQRSKS